MRKVFLENLPRRKDKTIDWNNCYGIILKFVYDNIEGEFELLDKIKNTNKINVKYLNNIIPVKTTAIKNCELGYLIGKMNYGFKYKINDIIKNKNGNIRIIDTFTIPKNNQNGELKYYKYKCEECGYEDKIYECNIDKGYGCPKCSKNNTRKINNAKKYIEVKDYINSLGLELLSKEYTGTHDNLKIKCKQGHEFERALSTFKGTPNRKGVKDCPICSGITINTYDSVKENLLSHNIKLLSEKYLNQDTKMKIKYISCGHEMNRNYYNIQKSNYECPKCKRKGYGRNTEQLKREIKYITKDEYKLLSEYKTMHDKVKVKHLKCNNIYEVTPHNFLDSGNRCPFCGQSKGENKISELLNKLNVNYVPQYSYDNLLSKYGNPLRFDFAIINNFNKIDFLIEYDGEFHYIKLYKEQDFEGQLERDELKNNYCKENNIDLLRIHYWEFDNLENILRDKLKKKGLI